jgi:hypothetical protein
VVALWAGHSVHVLLKIYANCIEGQDEAARRRIEETLGDIDDQGGSDGLMWTRPAPTGRTSGEMGQPSSR